MIDIQARATIKLVGGITLGSRDLVLVKAVALSNGIGKSCVHSRDKPSFTRCVGFIALHRARNECQSREMMHCNVDVNEKKVLFAEVAQAKKRMRRDEMQKMRSSMEMFDMELPAIGRFGGGSLSMTRPAHPSDDITNVLE